MGYHNGRFGTVNGQTAVRNWSITDTMAAEIYRASNTAIGQFVNDGVEDWSGSFQAFGGKPTLQPGEIFTFSGYTAPDDDTLNGVGTTVSGSAIVEQIVLNWNWQPSQSLGYTVNFAAASGGLTITPADTAILDVDRTIPDKMCGLIIDYGVALSEVELENIQNATLTLSSNNSTFVNSSTGCFTHRKAGGFDWSGSIVVQDTVVAVPKKTDERWRFWVDATEFWELQWGKVNEIGDLSVDEETQNSPVTFTYNLIMQGSDGTNLGTVTHPDTTTVYWPPT